MSTVEHEHSYGEWTSLYDGSNLQHGYEKRFCECGAFQARRIELDGDDTAGTPDHNRRV